MVAQLWTVPFCVSAGTGCGHGHGLPNPSTGQAKCAIVWSEKVCVSLCPEDYEQGGALLYSTENCVSVNSESTQVGTGYRVWLGACMCVCVCVCVCV